MSRFEPELSRARRSLLFVPGDDARKIAKAAAAGADSVVLDLEDGVAAGRKDAARDTIVSCLESLDFGRSERLIRINSATSGLQAADLDAALEANPDGWVIPKVESASQVKEVARRVGSLPLLALIESARGVISVADIAAAHPGLEALLFGAEDLAGDLGATRTRHGLEVAWARGAVVVAAAASSLQAIDTVFVDLGDLEGLAAEAKQACTMGYAGKMAIHPKQLPAIHEAFTPSDEEIERARRLVEVHTKHQAGGEGVFAYEGKMVDWPMIRAARRLLARARAAGKT